MTQIDWYRLRPILARLWDLPAAEHEEFLKQVCDGNERLADQARRMFREERDNDSFLSPIAGSGAGDPLTTALGLPLAGERIGPYGLLHEIGSGGMGSVWLARREDDAFDKHVAIKFVKPGPCSEDILNRFEHERQIMAWLDHPGIARLIDGGRTEQGLPFLVMDYVDGVPLDTYCDEQKLSIEGRIEVFLTVCDAVAHAHERGVLHRDLKPSNVLVDENGAARLLDFGIAKVLGADAQQALIELTRTGQRLYSPRYASPEQVRGELAGTTSDVYSLGVLLFELLTGRRPYRTPSVSQFELERVVCEERADRPSTSTGPTILDDGEPEAWSMRGFSDDRSHRKRLAGDLDWILLNCLRKHPDRRYGNASQLGADLRRHLANRPIEARPESLTYRASRFVRRNRVLVGSFTVLLLVISASLVVALDLLAQTRSAERSRTLEAYAASLQAAEGAILVNDLAQATTALERCAPELRGWEWRHLRQRLDRSVHVWDSPFQRFDRLHSVPHSDWIAIATGHRVELVSPLTGDKVVGPSLSGPGIRSDGCSPRTSIHPTSGVMLATFEDRRARVLDAATLEELQTLPPEHVQSAEFGPRGKRVALMLYSGDAVLLSWPELEQQARWSTGPDRPYFGRFSPDGKRLAVAGWDETVRLWRIDSSDPWLEAELAGHTMEMRSIAFDASGKRLATASLDQSVRVWPLDNLEEAALTFREHRTALTSVLFHPLRGTLISADQNGEVLHWDGATGRVLNRIRGLDSLGALGITRDGRYIAAGERNGEEAQLRVWPIDSQDVLTLRSCEFANTVAFTPDGQTLLCSSPDGVIRRWDRSGHELPSFSTDASPLRMAGRVGASGFMTAHEDRRLTHWSSSGQILGSVDDVLPASAAKPAWSLDSRGSRCVVGGRDLLRVFDMEDQRLEAECALIGADVNFVHWMRNSEEIVIGNDDGTLWRWRPGVDEAPRRAGKGSDAITAAAFDLARETSLLIVGRQGSIEIADLETGELTPVRRQGTVCASAAWHPSAPRFAVGHGDGSIGIWDADRLHELVRLHGHQGSVRSVAFSPDGSLLASCSDDGFVRLWDGPEAPGPADH